MRVISNIVTAAVAAMLSFPVCTAFAADPEECLCRRAESEDCGKIVLRLMGDSTMADKDLSRQNPERGWGQRLPSHLDTCVTVVNYAQNGRSTKSFISRGLWDMVKADLKAGDYLFIQFGHNDSKEDDPERYAPAYGLYTDNLEMFVGYALSVGANVST